MDNCLKLLRKNLEKNDGSVASLRVLQIAIIELEDLLIEYKKEQDKIIVPWPGNPGR